MNLQSNGAAHTDTHLVNAWGIAFNPTGFVWVANNGSATSTLYDGNGVPQTLVVAIPPGSAGVQPDRHRLQQRRHFQVTQNGVSGGSAFIFASENGTLSGWSPAVNRTNADRRRRHRRHGAVYKGLATASFSGASFLYAADFHNGRIDVYDSTWNRVTLPGGSFTIPTCPPAMPRSASRPSAAASTWPTRSASRQREREVKGAGLGIVDVFDAGGALVRRLVTGGALNAPWGLAMAPANFGGASNMLLVANFGDGKINAYNPTPAPLPARCRRPAARPSSSTACGASPSATA
jgi:uncharacterized protein (TIGR03118 family)